MSEEYYFVNVKMLLMLIILFVIGYVKLEFEEPFLKIEITYQAAILALGMMTLRHWTKSINNESPEKVDTNQIMTRGYNSKSILMTEFALRKTTLKSDKECFNLDQNKMDPMSTTEKLKIIRREIIMSRSSGWCQGFPNLNDAFIEEDSDHSSTDNFNLDQHKMDPMSTTEKLKIIRREILKQTQTLHRRHATSKIFS